MKGLLQDILSNRLEELEPCHRKKVSQPKVKEPSSRQSNFYIPQKSGKYLDQELEESSNEDFIPYHSEEETEITPKISP